jgi:hypothetical protein
MTDLILRTRLEALENSLQRATEMLDLVKERRKEIQHLRYLLTGGQESIPTSITYIEEKILVSRRRLEFEGEGEVIDAVLTNLDEAYKEIQKVLGYIRSAREDLHRVYTRSVEIECTGPETPLAAIAASEISNQATECQTTLTKIRAKLNKAMEAENKGDTPTADKLRAAAWEEYAREATHGDIPRVFTEYVDFLRGLAMRDAGLDGEICQIADELTGKWKITDVDHSLTIPARQEAVTMTLARIIRLGFPEWTIWALPLTAHEFGHVAATKTKLDDFVENIPSAQTQYPMQEFLADAFATYLMGPAYACAAILLRLNPPSAYEEKDKYPTDSRRAHIVFIVLDWMNEQTVSKPYTGIISKLREEWTAALNQARPPVELETEVEAELEMWIAPLEDKLKKITVGYPVEAWARADSLSKLLLQDQSLKKASEEVYDLRDVLNAAWSCRIENPTQTEEIEKAAYAFWHHIVESRKPSRAAMTPGWTKRGG